MAELPGQNLVTVDPGGREVIRPWQQLQPSPRPPRPPSPICHTNHLPGPLKCHSNLTGFVATSSAPLAQPSTHHICPMHHSTHLARPWRPSGRILSAHRKHFQPLGCVPGGRSTATKFLRRANKGQTCASGESSSQSSLSGWSRRSRRGLETGRDFGGAAHTVCLHTCMCTRPLE